MDANVVFCLCLFSLGYHSHSFEPGHADDQDDYVEEVHTQTEEVTTEQLPEDAEWIPEAILDIAYYLRRHKFSGYDRRYKEDEKKASKKLFKNFPKPPLRTIHWEVKKNCEPSFFDCIRYLSDVIGRTELPRHLDVLTILKQNPEMNQTEIKTTNDECLDLLEEDGKTFKVFQGPLQKFQWLVSASYYMCWFTMREISFLRHFEDSCDDFASCIDAKLGARNKDVRANDSIPFACAGYSFCPDSCCPVKFAGGWNDCLASSPCHRQKPKNASCEFIFEENTDFEAMVLNHWNISCHCPDDEGFRWESKSGMCVDVDECTDGTASCSAPSETCFNLPGSFDCGCSAVGYHLDKSAQACFPDRSLHHVFHPKHTDPKNMEEPKSIADRIEDFIRNLKDSFSFSALNATTPNPEQKP